MLILHRALGLFGLLGRLLCGGPAITLAPRTPHAPAASRFAKPRRPRKPSNYYTPNGARECARRRRQIELGQLRVTP